MGEQDQGSGEWGRAMIAFAVTLGGKHQAGAEQEQGPAYHDCKGQGEGGGKGTCRRGWDLKREQDGLTP